jgi:acyl-CoA dehydrogenase
MARARTAEDLSDIRAAVGRLCEEFPAEYWRELEPATYPTEFVDRLTREGWLAALIPEEFGGAGLSLSAASVILEEINASGGNSAACHAQMYTMNVLLRHGSEEQKRRYLPQLATGDLRLQAFAVTEPGAGSDTKRIKTTARRNHSGDYTVNGQKVFISRAAQSDLMLLLARTEAMPGNGAPAQELGLSMFLIDLREVGSEITIRPVRTMMNHSSTEVFFNDLLLKPEALIGTEGNGFKYVLDGMNAERILIAAECIGDGRWFIERARKYASERVVFGRPIGANQGVQFPIASAHVGLEAADLMRQKAAQLFEVGEPCGAEANMAKYLASEASWRAANVCLDTHGGWGFAVEYDIERKFRETRLYQVAPVTNNLILAFLSEHVLGMPRSY